MARKSISSVLGRVAPKKDESAGKKVSSLFDRLNSTSPLDAEPGLSDLAREVSSFPARAPDRSHDTTETTTFGTSPATTLDRSHDASSTPTGDRSLTPTNATAASTTDTTSSDRSNPTTIDRLPDMSHITANDRSKAITHDRSPERAHDMSDSTTRTSTLDTSDDMSSDTSNERSDDMSHDLSSAIVVSSDRSFDTSHDATTPPTSPRATPRKSPRPAAARTTTDTTHDTSGTITLTTTSDTTELVLRGLSVQQRKILDHFLRTTEFEKSTVTKIGDLGKTLGIPLDSMKRCLRQLEMSGFLKRQKIVKGSFQGIAINLCRDLCEAYWGDTSRNTTLPTTHDTSPVVVRDESRAAASARSSVVAGDRSSVVEKSPLLEEERKNLSIYAGLRGISEEDFTAFWPDLAATGFGTHQVRQLYEKRSRLEKSVDYLQQGFDHADAALRLGSLKGARGESVQNPCAYIFSAMLRDGSFPKPAGWISPEEEAKREAEAQLKAVQDTLRIQQELSKATKEADFEKEFVAWREHLTQRQLEEALAGRKGPEDVWLKRIFRERSGA